MSFSLCFTVFQDPLIWEQGVGGSIPPATYPQMKHP